MRMSPPLGSTSRLTMRSSVVLPEPDGPTMAVIECGATEKLTSSTAARPL